MAVGLWSVETHLKAVERISSTHYRLDWWNTLIQAILLPSRAHIATGSSWPLSTLLFFVLGNRHIACDVTPVVKSVDLDHVGRVYGKGNCIPEIFARTVPILDSIVQRWMKGSSVTNEIELIHLRRSPLKIQSTHTATREMYTFTFTFAFTCITYCPSN